ncbi:virulence RhuM family protein [Lonepinella sp. BR2474]|uniref:virulence RhuM family protein n=1 Tax=Lonepinella sp. BR2474 TaxID=3434548 RepID=UPI003F6E1528
MNDQTAKGEVVLYQNSQDKPALEVHLDNGNLWLSQADMAQLYQTTKQNISKHIKAIFDSGELDEEVVVNLQFTTTQHGAMAGKTQTKAVKYYNLEMIIAVGYRVRSTQGTRFRQWATERLNEYLVKGFTMDDERLKNNGGGNYWKDLLNRIRDIRSSEKMLYRQVLDLYATAMDYDPSSSQTQVFFQTVQNKLHYSTSGQTSAEIIFFRTDHQKDFMGLTNFVGKQPTLREAKTAKNYLSEDELFRLNRLVSAFFDLAEIKAIEHTPMYMQNWVEELDRFLAIYGNGVLQDKGSISREQAEQKAELEFRAYEVKTLSPVEQAYFESLKSIGKIAKKASEN